MPESPAPPAATSRTRSAPRTARERVRRELTSEIKQVALAQLASSGGAALSLRAIAREMGMASSALFRYFRNRDALLTALIIDSYSSLAEAAETAEARVHHGLVEDRWVAICRGVRTWAVAHPHQYALIFGSPIPGYAAPPGTVGPATRVPLLLSELLGDLEAGRLGEAGQDAEDAAYAEDAEDAAYAAYAEDAEDAEDAAYAADAEVPLAVRRAIEPVRSVMPEGVSDDLIVRGLMAWTYLFGAVSFEVFGHRHNVIADHDAFFDQEIRRMAGLVGLAPARPRRSRRRRAGLKLE